MTQSSGVDDWTKLMYQHKIRNLAVAYGAGPLKLRELFGWLAADVAYDPALVEDVCE